jgi:hypothetical protein
MLVRRVMDWMSALVDRRNAYHNGDGITQYSRPLLLEATKTLHLGWI